MDTKPIFIACDISDAARDAVMRYVGALRGDFRGVRARWLPPQNLHITLRFVGNVNAEELRSVRAEVCRAASEIDTFTGYLEGTGNFAQRKIRQDALWIGVRSDPATALEELAQLLSAGERRKFVPHLTIARLKDPQQGRELVVEHLRRLFPPVEFTIDHLTIYESILGPTGSSYKVLEQVALRTKDDLTS